MPESDDTPNDRSLQIRSEALDLVLEILEHRGEPVLTLQMIDKAHQRPDGTAGRNLREHRARFVEGEDFHELTADEIRRQSLEAVFPPRTPKGILLTESGYLMLVKSFTDDLAWRVQRQLVKSYFRRQPSQVVPLIPQTLPDALRLAADLADDLNAEKAKTAEMAPKVAAFEQIAGTDGSFTPTDAAKTLGVPPRKMTSWLRMNRWTYRRLGSSDDVAYEDKLKSGHLVHKTQTVQRLDGSDKVITRARITPKGLAKLALVFGVILEQVA